MRLSNLFSVLLGALAVGAVVAVLAVTGALPDKVERTTDDDGRPRSPPPPGVADRAHERRRHLLPRLRQRGLRLRPRRQRPAPFNGRAAARPRPAPASSSTPPATSSPTTTSSRTPTKFAVRFGEKGEPIPAKLVGKDPSSDLAVLKIDPGEVKGGAQAAPARLLESLRPARPRSPSASPFGPLRHRHHRHRLRARPRDRGAQRLLDPRRRADRRRHQPRQLGRPAARRRRPRDRRQLADRLPQRRQHRRRLRRPGRQRPERRPAAGQDGGKIERAYLGLASGERPARPGALVGTVARRARPSRPASAPATSSRRFDGKPIRSPSELSLGRAHKPRRQGEGRGQARRRPAHRDRRAGPAPESGGAVNQPEPGPRTLKA